MPRTSWFSENAASAVPRTGISDPNPPLLQTPDGAAPYVPPTGGINPGGMYSGTSEPSTTQGDANEFRDYLGNTRAPSPYATTIGGGPSTPTSAPTTWDEATFSAQFGRPGTPQELIAQEAALNAQGIKVLRNAAGVAGKIQLPNGQIVDVINSAGLGGRGFQWDAGTGGGGYNSFGAEQPYAGTFTGGGRYPMASVMGSGLMQPWTTPFEGGPNFQAPTDVTQQNDPGWQFRMKEGLDAIQRSAASKGTLLTGGAMKDLMAFGQDFASNEYGNVYNRAASEWDRNYNRALGEYNNAYNIFGNNQANQFGRLNALSQSGLTAAGGVNANNSGYAANAGDIMTGIGNVNAAGTMGSANAWSNVPGQLVNTWGPLAQWYATRPGTSGTGVSYNGYGAKSVPLDPNLGGGWG